ncbi:hypothetical protein ACFXHA_42565 [Nocardia sp. NPDC059240]|uniref:hypothetical protein n=1 Tax=Nocardia sp. NPDC059240 TaxID=3346786 RepID=UPI0036BB1E4D
MTALEVTPDNLRKLAGGLALLPKDINDMVALGAQPVADVLKGSGVGTALGRSDGIDTTARAVLEARFNTFSGLLVLSADKYNNHDEDVADRLNAVADLNSGTPGKK